MIRENLYDVEAIVGERIGDSGEQFYLVKWEGYGDEESTWEPEDNIPGHFVTDWNESKEIPDETDLDVSDDEEDDDTIHLGQRHIEIIDLTSNSDDENDEKDQNDDPDETNDELDRVVIFINSERPTYFGADNGAAGKKDNSHSIANHEAIEIVGEIMIPPLYKIRWRPDPNTGRQRKQSWLQKRTVGQSLVDAWKESKMQWRTVMDRSGDVQSDDEHEDNSKSDEVERTLDVFGYAFTDEYDFIDLAHTEAKLSHSRRRKRDDKAFDEGHNKDDKEMNDNDSTMDAPSEDVDMEDVSKLWPAHSTRRSED